MMSGHKVCLCEVEAKREKCVCECVCMCVYVHVWCNLKADVESFPQLIFILIYWARVSEMNCFLLID